MSPFGRQWFSLQSRTAEAVQAGVRAAALILDGFLDEALGVRGLDASRLALLGFSQGTMMALFVGLRRSKAVAAILGFSGRFSARAAARGRSSRGRRSCWSMAIAIRSCRSNCSPWRRPGSRRGRRRRAARPSGNRHTRIDKEGLRRGGAFLREGSRGGPEPPPTSDGRRPRRAMFVDDATAGLKGPRPKSAPVWRARENSPPGLRSIQWSCEANTPSPGFVARRAEIALDQLHHVRRIPIGRALKPSEDAALGIDEEAGRQALDRERVVDIVLGVEIDGESPSRSGPRKGATAAASRDPRTRREWRACRAAPGAVRATAFRECRARTMSPTD